MIKFQIGPPKTLSGIWSNVVFYWFSTKFQIEAFYLEFDEFDQIPDRPRMVLELSGISETRMVSEGASNGPRMIWNLFFFPIWNLIDFREIQKSRPFEVSVQKTLSGISETINGHSITGSRYHSRSMVIPCNTCDWKSVQPGLTVITFPCNTCDWKSDHSQSGLHSHKRFADRIQLHYTYLNNI